MARLIALVTALVVAMTIVATGANAQVGGSLELVAQSAWVDDGGVFDFQVRIAGADPDSSVTVEVFPPIAARSQLGTIPEDTEPLLVVGERSLTDLQDTSNAVLPLQIAVAGPDTEPADTVAISDDDPEPIPVLETEGTSGIYPMRIRLFRPDATVADEILTHLIELPRGRVSDPFDVVIVIPVDLEVERAADGSTSLALDAELVLEPLVDALESHPDSPVTIAISPEDLDALATADSDLARTLRDRLAALLTPDELIAGPLVDVDEQAWLAASLDEELADLYDDGRRAVVAAVGFEPDSTVALPDPTMDADGLGWLAERGVRGVVLDSSQLSRVDRNLFDTPLVSSFLVQTGTETAPMPALEIDARLSELLASTEAGRDANRLLAELTARSLDDPQTPRATVLRTDPDRIPSRSFLNVLLTGIERIPTLTAATPSAALTRVAFVPASGTGTIGSPLRRDIVAEDSPGLGLFRTEYNQAEAAITSWETVVASGVGARSDLRTLLRASTDPELSDIDRSAYIDAIYRTIDDEKRNALDPQPIETITVTSRETRIPIVVTNRLDRDVSVVMVLDSEKLSFPEGNEVAWTLQPGENRVEIPIRALASGDSPIRVQLLSPDRQVLLGSTEVLLRTVAFSGVGIVIGAVAIGVLLLWWLRHRRSQRATLGPAEPDLVPTGDSVS